MSNADSARGGRREGAGRKPLDTGRVTRCYALTEHHVALIEQYRQAHDFKSASEALRILIERYGPDRS